MLLSRRVIVLALSVCVGVEDGDGWEETERRWLGWQVHLIILFAK
jgi:hypothetical protein